MQKILTTKIKMAALCIAVLGVATTMLAQSTTRSAIEQDGVRFDGCGGGRRRR